MKMPAYYMLVSHIQFDAELCL